MSDVRFREARQSHSRKVAAGDHGIAGLPTELVVPGFEIRNQNERRKFDFASADLAQTRTGFDDQGSARTSAYDVRADDERAGGLSGSSLRAGTNR